MSISSKTVSGRLLPLLLLLLFLLPSPGRAAAGTTDPSTSRPAFPPPGADALNLKISKRYEIAADGSVRHHLYVRRRILTYKGKKDYADFKYTYNRAYQEARLVRARTFKADGQTVAVGKEEVL